MGFLKLSVCPNESDCLIRKDGMIENYNMIVNDLVNLSPGAILSENVSDSLMDKTCSNGSVCLYKNDRVNGADGLFEWECVSK